MRPLIFAAAFFAFMTALARAQDSSPDLQPALADKPAPQPAPVPGDVPAPSESIPPNVLPTPTLTPDFGIPDGLRTAPEILLPSLGFGPSHTFPLTPTTCFDAGYKCYVRGLYGDALAFANHGLKLCNHARLYLLKAMCEMQLARSEDAKSTIVHYRYAALRPQESFGLAVARERLNDPMRVRLEALLDAWNGKY